MIRILETDTLPAFVRGDRVRKRAGGDYAFEGTVVAAFVKLSGKFRFVVENADGLLFIFNETQLEPVA